MARHQSANAPYQWANGTYHTKPQKRTPQQQNTYNSYKRKYGSVTLGPNTSPADKKRAGGMVSEYVKRQGKPAVPAAATPPVQPLDPNVVNEQVTANRNIAVGDLYSTWQQGNLDQQYGFGAAGASNPYSEAAKLQESYKRSVTGTTGSFGAQGQYNSGAYGRAQNENARNYDIGYDQLRRGYDQASGNLQFDRLQRYADAGTSIDQSKFQAILTALGAL